MKNREINVFVFFILTNQLTFLHHYLSICKVIFSLCIENLPSLKLIKFQFFIYMSTFFHDILVFFQLLWFGIKLGQRLYLLDWWPNLKIKMIFSDCLYSVIPVSVCLFLCLCFYTFHIFIFFSRIVEVLFLQNLAQRSLKLR